MKKISPLWLFILLSGMIIYGGSYHNASAHLINKYRIVFLSAPHQQVAETPAPTSDSSAAFIETPEARQLPPVGSNAVLVIGASVIVLIIIGGVLGTRRRPKH
jgi:hypothetical protein